MALSGLHVTCGFVGIKGGASLLAATSWSQTMSAAGATTQGAKEPGARPTQNYDALLLGFEVTASQDAFVSVGTAPDAVNGTRIFVPGGQPKNIFCNSGDLLAWTFA